MRRSCQLLSLALLCAFAPRTARADDSADGNPLLEEPRQRQGYWIGFGPTGIAAGLRENGKNLGIYSGYTGTFRIGQLVTQRLGLGLMIEYLMGNERLGKGSDKGSIGGLTLEGSCQLWRNLSAHTGFGIGYVMVKDPNALDDSLRGGGGAYLLLGASYDFFPFQKQLTGGWAVTPTVDLHVMPDGNIKFVSVMAGLQLTWWSGLSDNMLHLPDE